MISGLRKNNHKLSHSQSYLYISNKLLKYQNKNVFAFTSSTVNLQFVRHLCKQMACNLKARDKKVLFVDCVIKDSSANGENIIKAQPNANVDTIHIENISPDKFSDLIEKSKNDYSYIIISIPPISTYANALEYATQADGIMLIERYGYTKYRCFENMLSLVEQNNLDVLGIIAAK